MPEALTKTQFLVDWLNTKSRFNDSPAKGRFFHFWRSRNPLNFSSFHTLSFACFSNLLISKGLRTLWKNMGVCPTASQNGPRKSDSRKSELKKVGLKEEKQLGFGT
jgi:hypothetical protein